MATLTGILDELADRLYRVSGAFSTESSYTDLKKDIADVREQFPVDIAEIVRAESGK